MVTLEQVDRVAEIIASAPPWARSALTSSDERLRAQGAEAISAFLLKRIGEPLRHDQDQLALPIAS